MYINFYYDLVKNQLKNEPWASGEIYIKFYYDLVKNQLKNMPWALGEIYISNVIII